MRRTLSARFLAGCAVLALIVAGSFATMLSGVLAERDASREARVSDAETSAAASEEKLVVDLETGLRGYQLTRDEAYLAPYVTAVNSLSTVTGRLSRLVGNEAGEKREVDAIAESVTEYVRDYAQPLVSRIRTGRMTPGQRASVLASGKRRVDGLRARFARYVSAERGRAETAHLRADDSARKAMTFGSIGLAGSLLIIGLFCCYQVAWVLRPVRRAGAAVRRLAGGDLTARVPETGSGEVGDLGRDFNAMADSLEHTRDELESQNSELEAQQGELERAVDELAWEKERIERLHSFGQSVSAEIELEAVGRTALGELAALMGAEIGAVYAVIPGREAAPCIATLGLGEAGSMEPITPNLGLAGRALSEGVLLMSGHVDVSLRVPTLAGEADVRQEAHVPMVHGHRVVGLITLARVSDQPFGPSETEQIGHFANRAAASVAHALTLREARNQAALNHAVLDTAADAFVSIDAGGLITAWNAAAERLFGWSLAEAIGRPYVATLVPERLREAHIGRVAAAGRKGTKIGADRQIELTGLHRDGSEIPIEATISPLVRDGELSYNAFLRDISDGKRTARYMAAQYAVTRVLSETASLDEARTAILEALGVALGWRAGAIWLTDEEAGVVSPALFWSEDGSDVEAFRRDTEALTLVRGEGLPGHVWDTGEATSIEDVAADPGFERVASAARSDLHGAVAFPVFGGGKAVGIVEFYGGDPQAHDPTLLALLETIGAQIGHYSERRQFELEADRLKDEFFALVSHELRTPLTSIIGYLELVLEEPEKLDPETSRFLQVVERNSRRLYRLVGDLLFVAQVEAGKLALEKTAIPMAQLVADSVEAARPRAEENGVVLKLRAEDIGSCNGDPDRIGQTLDNLISNAIKFTPDGGNVDVYLSRRGDDALIEVRDSGIGIPAGEQDRLFQRFFRSSTATEQAIPGVGLGLTISRAIVQGHGGTIDFESEEGRGTTFRVALPLASTERSKLQPTPTEALL
ncbi:MAG: hypothetical protein QOJ07_2318 [Thermoleophilaceae bacterium]|nr:hypothetical protein [Thermoleophilaceae bacterium]